MSFNNVPTDFELRRSAIERITPRPFMRAGRGREERDAENGMAAIALEENWLAPLPEVTRITLSPWQQAVFWGLRIYIVVMLAVMGLAFFRNLGG